MENFNFETSRLLVQRWDSPGCRLDGPQMQAAVVRILSPKVTEFLPDSFGGPYDTLRAERWLEERSREGTGLVVIAKRDDTIGYDSDDVVGFLLLFAKGEESDQMNLGYMLGEIHWGRGFATEFVHGLVKNLRKAGVKRLVGGVVTDNPASRRVLEKCGFKVNEQTPDRTDMLQLDL